MSVQDVSTVDAIGIDSNTGQTVLTIFDHLPWEAGHFDVLKEKLKTYIAFVRSGQLPPSVGDTTVPVLVSLILKYAPTPEAQDRLQKVFQLMRESGLDFEFKPIPDVGYLKSSE